MDVRRKIAGRWAAAGIAIAIALSPTSANASPDAPGQSDPEYDDRASDTEALLVDVDALVATDASAISTTLGDLSVDVSNQLAAYNAAQQAVSTANQARADADNAVANTEILIETTTAESDSVVVDAFITPSSDNALSVLSADDLTEATIEQTLLEMDRDESAQTLTGLQEALTQYEAQLEAQEASREAAELAQEEAEAAFDELESTLSAHAQFVTAVNEAVANQQGAALPTDPAAAAAQQARIDEINGVITTAVAERQAAEDARLAEQRRREQAESAGMYCPVEAPVDFIDSWGYARSGGRSHKGVDMMAARGQATPSPVSGEVEHRGSSLGGLSWYVYGDNGNTYYGTHLSAYENQGVGWVEAGTIIGYVGDTGNARGTPHLHFEIHPGGGSPINPYPATARACFGG